MIVTSNSPSPLGEIFGDEVVAAAMIDRLVHHAEILAINVTQALSLDGWSRGRRWGGVSVQMAGSSRRGT
jgi:IstB-like ATP binding protein